MEAQRYERTTNHRAPPEIDGRSWQIVGQGVAKCAIAPGRKPPAEAQVVTGHPTKPGWRIAWLFLAGLIAAFIASPWIAKFLACAVIVLPLWVLR